MKSGIHECHPDNVIGENRCRTDVVVVHVETDLIDEYRHGFGIMTLRRCKACGLEIREYSPTASVGKQ